MATERAAPVVALNARLAPRASADSIPMMSLGVAAGAESRRQAVPQYFGAQAA